MQMEVPSGGLAHDTSLVQQCFMFRKILCFLFPEFASVYERLNVTLIERGESFYQNMMGKIVEGLDEKGVVFNYAR